MPQFLQFANDGLFVYYLCCNLIYLGLLVTAFYTSARHQRRLESHRLEWIHSSVLTPPITILVPAHNEEKSIRASIQSMMELDYPELEIIVVNDGSEDRTLEELTDAFVLRQINALYIAQVPSMHVRSLYRSSRDPRLLVIDKESGGSKADALNAGLNAATSPWICVVDSDSMLERDALLRIMTPVLFGSQNIVGAGGIVRVLNGSLIENGRMKQARLPRRPIEAIQVIEYLRAFLVGREAWATLNMLMIISGAFGIFRTEMIRAIGGYRANSIGEDFDLIARIHRYLLERGENYRVQFVPDPVCWTEVPFDWRSLARQRMRWQKGLLDVLWSSRDMLFRPAYGSIGVLALPYLWLFELFAPVIEIGGIATMVLAGALGALSREFFLQFMLFGYAFATLISIGSVLQEELTYKRYNDWGDVARLIVYCLAEHFPYRQLQMFWRIEGMWQYFRGDVIWHKINRHGIRSSG
jgi:cellulose synthase/poly-beta-1,6-N-acetylglucosamine synthase-like glycosyltransferase